MSCRGKTPALTEDQAGRAWFEEFATGRARSLHELAKRDGISRRYIRRKACMRRREPPGRRNWRNPLGEGMASDVQWRHDKRRHRMSRIGIAFGAQPPDLRFAPLMDMDFATRCSLVRRLRLVSGSCPSARTFASRFLQTRLAAIALAHH
jgi:hypothetical protein